MAEKEICRECGEEIRRRGHLDYCFDCYSKIWDNGFESTSDHAYKIGFDELVRTLDGPCTDESRAAAKEIMLEWGHLDWKCQKCGKLRLEKEPASKMLSDDKVEFLCQPCAGCGAVGHFRPVTPGKYFH